MAITNSKYETLYIINANLSEEDTAAVVERFKNLVESAGTLTKIDEWGKRRLAYPINYMNEGYYVLMEYTAPADFPAEIDRNFNIVESVIRGMTINKDEYEEAPAAETAATEEAPAAEAAPAADEVPTMAEAEAQLASETKTDAE